jgi:hypothetical protein
MSRAEQKGQGGPAGEAAANYAAVLRVQALAQAARRDASHWEREAVMRASSVASALAGEILAGRRLARAVQSFLSDARDDPTEMKLAVQFFEEVSGMDASSR